jgi:hypothetical protein
MNLRVNTRSLGKLTFVFGLTARVLSLIPLDITPPILSRHLGLERQTAVALVRLAVVVD